MSLVPDQGAVEQFAAAGLNPAFHDRVHSQAKALRPVAGSFAEELFAFGFNGTGMLAVPVLAGSASFGLSGLLGKRSGYSRR